MRAASAIGRGAVVRDGLHACAAHRDDAGDLHELSAACPHVGCVVAWKPVERTWDCPCHGSRFGATGELINGAANVVVSPRSPRQGGTAAVAGAALPRSRSPIARAGDVFHSTLLRSVTMVAVVAVIRRDLAPGR